MLNAAVQQLINKTPWAELDHAYGKAKEVPELLMAIQSADATVRDKGWFELWGNIWHQGTVYPATEPAAKVLLELVSDPVTPDRPQILVMLMNIAHGAGYLQVHADGCGCGYNHCSEEDLAAERVWVQAAHNAVRDGLPLLLALLDDADPRVRETVPGTLARLPEVADQAIPAIERRLAVESDLRTQAGLLLGLGARGANSPTAKQVIWSKLNCENPVGLAAAMASAWIDDGRLSEPAAEILRKEKKRIRRDEGFLGSIWGGIPEMLGWLERWGGCIESIEEPA